MAPARAPRPFFAFFPTVEAAVPAQLPHREVLDDAVLDVLEAGVVGVEDVSRRLEIEVILGALAPRQLEDRVEPGPNPTVLGTLFAGAIEAIDLAFNGLCDVGGEVERLEAGPIVRVAAGGALTELLLDGFELLAQDVLALRLVDARRRVVADLLVDVEARQDLVHPPQHLFQPTSHVECLEDLDLLREREVGGVDGKVRQLAGTIDVQNARRHRADAAVVENLFDDGPVLGGESPDVGIVRDVLFGDAFGLDP